jgi:hypothetical protein
MTETQQNKIESSSMALSGMMLAIIGLICSFIPSWRTIGMVIALGGLILSLFNFVKAKRSNVKTTRSVIGLICGALAICIASYFLFIQPVNRHAPGLSSSGSSDTNKVEH